MEGWRGPGDRSCRDGTVAAEIHFCFTSFTVWGATSACSSLTLTPNTWQQQCIESGIQSWAVGWVWMKHRVMMPCVDVGMGPWVWVIDIMNIGVATCALGTQTVCPAIRKGSWRRYACLRKDMAGPQGSIRMTEGNGAGGEIWVNGDRHRWETGVGLRWERAAPRRTALTIRMGTSIWNKEGKTV